MSVYDMLEQMVKNKMLELHDQIKSVIGAEITN